MRWIVKGYGISLVIAFVFNEIQARFIPPQNDVITELTEGDNEDQTRFLDQIGTAKVECLLKYIEQPGAQQQCIDKLFGDERSQFLLSELSNELAGDVTTEQGRSDEDNDDQDDDDQLVADLNILSKQKHRSSTVNDDVPIINSDMQKRVDEQVDTPKNERRNPPIVAEIVKTDDNDEDNDEDNADVEQEDYEYDSSLVNKLYNMLQDLVLRETLEYGLDMKVDDNDSEEEVQDNENAIATDGEEDEDDDEEEEEEDVEEGEENEVVDSKAEEIQSEGQMFDENAVAQTEQAGSDSDEEEDEEEEEAEEGLEEEGQVGNELGAENVDEGVTDDEDEIEKELEQMHGTRAGAVDENNADEESEGGDDDEESEGDDDDESEGDDDEESESDDDDEESEGDDDEESEGDDDDEEVDDDEDEDMRNIAQVENDLVKELDRMLSMARQAVAAEGDMATSTTDIDEISNNNLLQDLQNLEKQLKNPARR